MKLAAMEKEPDAKKVIWELLGADMPRLAAALLAEGQGARLEEVLEQGLAGEGEQPRANYAAWLMLRGKLDEKIRDLQKKGAPDKKAALTLAYLCRAKDDLAGARKYAVKADHPGLLRTVLTDQEDWKALLKRLDEPPFPAGGEEGFLVGPRLACLRLMGDRAGFAAELARVMDDASALVPDSAFLLNGRPDDALASLRKWNNHRDAAKLLAARLRFREALDEIDLVKATEMERTPLVAWLTKTELLARVGERKKARAVLDKLWDDGNLDFGFAHFILRDEYNAGFKDEAFAHAAALMPKVLEKGDWMAVNVLFRSADLEGGVEPRWTFLRSKFPKDDAAATLKRMRDLFGRKTPAREAADLLREMADEAARRKDQERGPWLQCVADTCRALGRDDLCGTYLEKWAAAGDARAGLRLGDLSADAGRWKDAAERYRKGWETDRGSALLLYLRGHALLRAGQEKEGRRWMEVAVAMPLGNEDRLTALAAGLDERGLAGAAGKVWERLSRLALMVSFKQSAIDRGMADRAAARKDYTRAATWTRREVLFNLWWVPIREDPEPLLSLVASEHRYRALAHVAAGRLDDMRKEVDAVLAVDPNIEVAIDLVTELTKRGHKKEADDLFGRVYTANDAVCREYPKSGWAHNNTAWLAVRCKRNLDAALEHARKAVELEPDQPGHLDTLAEVHFQRGDKDKAVELEKKCVAMQPSYDYFRKQVKRMQAGDRDAELPPEPAGSLYRSLVEPP